MKGFGQTSRNNTNRGQRSQGACGGTPRRDGSGGGKGNRGTPRQPTGAKK